MEQIRERLILERTRSRTVIEVRNYKGFVTDECQFLMSITVMLHASSRINRSPCHNLTCELGEAGAAGMLYIPWLKSWIWEVLATSSSLVSTGPGVLLAVQVWHEDDGSVGAMLASEQWRYNSGQTNVELVVRFIHTMSYYLHKIAINSESCKLACMRNYIHIMQR